MKKLVFTVLFFSACTAGVSQVGIVSFTNNAVIFKDDEALMMATVSNVGCEQVYLTCEQGTFEYFPGCRYVFHPKVVGPAKIKIHYIKDGDTILSAIQQFEIYERPSPKAEIGGRSNGTVSKSFFNEGLLKGSYYIHGKLWENCRITSFDVMITRNGKVISFNHNQSGKFNAMTKALLDSVSPGDRVAFINVLGGREVKSIYLSGLEFSIN